MVYKFMVQLQKGVTSVVILMVMLAHPNRQVDLHFHPIVISILKNSLNHPLLTIITH